MKFYSRPRRMPQVIIVSLIDIFAILLIFVIVTTTFKRLQPEVTIKLPESKSAVASEQKSDEPIILSIAENEDIFLAAKKVTLAELSTAVQKLVEEEGRPNLAMKADKKVSYGFLIQVLDALKDAGVKGNLSAFTEAKK